MAAQVFKPTINPHESNLPNPMSEVSIFPLKVGEGNDFATQVLKDPWNMQEFADISAYLNESNVVTHLDQILVTDGIFSAHTVSSDPQFYTVFPGFQSSIDAINDPIKIGSLYPIESNLYHCLFTRMQVGKTDSSDGIRIFWFGNNNLAYGAFGVTKSIPTPENTWQLYSADLNINYDPLNSTTPWSELPEWQGLRLDPTGRDEVDFAVDWVRLTDCQAVNVNINWQPIDGEIRLWAGINQTEPDFPISTTDGSSGRATIDVQGWEPARYYIGVETPSGAINWSSIPLTIDPAPRVEFISPSYDSGGSLIWEMNSLDALVTDPLIGTQCMNYAVQNGILDLDTLPPGALPSECTIDLGNGLIVSDPQLILNMPVDKIDTQDYRYLTIRTYMEGQIQDINRGWVFRWLWKTYDNDDLSQWCINVSNDIPFSPGWQTIVVDLHNPQAGLAEDAAGLGNCVPRLWTDNSTDWLRLDINENATDTTFHQQIDYIRLSRPERVFQGENYNIQFDISEYLSASNLNIYYTTDPANPTQFSANIPDLTTVVPPGNYQVYLPITLASSSGTMNTTPAAISEFNLNWDTTGVPPGEYYICLESNDGYNQAIHCSPTPVEVTIPPTGLNVELSTYLVTEGKDYAAVNLDDGWDMDRTADLHYDIPGMGTTIADAQVHDDIFYAQTTTSDSWVFPLFPDFSTSPPTPQGTVDPKIYHCLYLRMMVENGSDPYDELRFWWFTDYTLTNKAFGVTPRIAPIGPKWKIYQFDLNMSSDPSLTPWIGGNWQVLRLDPSTRNQTSFGIDWLRLTDCNSVNTTITWNSTGGKLDIWAGIDRQAQDIQVASLFPGEAGSFPLDVQGWEPGTYYVGVYDHETEIMHWSSSPLRITSRN